MHMWWHVYRLDGLYSKVMIDMTMMMDMKGAIAIFTTMRVIEMTMVMYMTTMMDIGRVIALIFTTKEAGMIGLVCRRGGQSQLGLQ